MSGRGNDVGVWNGAGVQTRGDKTCNVSHVNHQISADLVGDAAELRKVDHARICARARDYHFGAAFERQSAHLVVVDALGRGVNAVVDYVEIFARNIQLHAVRKMPAGGKAHRKHGVARLEQRKKDRKVCRCAAVGLNVGVLGAEKTAGTLTRQLFYLVNIGAAAVVAVSGITLGVFVGEHAARGEKHRLGDDIFGRDELYIAALTRKLAGARSADLGVERGKIFKKHNRTCLSIGEVLLLYLFIAAASRAERRK